MKKEGMIVMKGLELSEEYYNFYGRIMIHEKFPEYEKLIAAGMVGKGSECLGFDDELSQEHDFGPGFCLWLTDEDYKEIGQELAFEYERLPKDFGGMEGHIESALEGGRVGVFSTRDFYYDLIGREDAPVTNMDWLWIPEARLATATSGRVFRDDYCEFSRLRKHLQKYYPEDVRIKKIVSRAAYMAQAGQYNYVRCMRRGESVAAYMALTEFVKNTISMVYLLNRQYAPYYKWSHHGMRFLKILPEVSLLLTKLCQQDNQREVWEKNQETAYTYALNAYDKNMEIIGTVCALVVEELNRQGMTDHSDPMLENHTENMMDRIQDSAIKALGITEG